LPYGQFSRELVGVGVAAQCGAKGRNPEDSAPDDRAGHGTRTETIKGPGK
jgi:hypothetical protein